MEAVPPLPWAAAVQGGTLKLSKAVSIQDLLDGVLKIRVEGNHGETDGEIIKYPSDNKIYIDDGQGNFMYEIERFEGSSKTIRLTKTGSTPSTEALISVQFAPPVEYSPALPWNSQTQNAKIKLFPPLDEEDLTFGGLEIVCGDLTEPEEDRYKLLCYYDSDDETIKNTYESDVAAANVESSETGSVKQISISNIDGDWEISKISLGSSALYLLPSNKLPKESNNYISCSQPLTFEQILAHVKVKMSGSDEWLSANQRDQFACDWKPEFTSPNIFTLRRSNNNGSRIIELLASNNKFQLIDIKYEP